MTKQFMFIAVMHSFFLLPFIFSQPVLQGTARYTQTRYFEFENMPADMPKSQESFMRLSFDKTSSLYEKDPDKKEEVNPNDNSPRMFRRMRERDNRTVYKESGTGTMSEQVSFFGKDFLIQDSIHAIRWKISAGEQKSILGYTCMKATFKDSTQNLVAFFTPQIPLKWGPDKYGNLPGLILELQSAQLHILATDLNTDKAAITKPEKGQSMTRKEFDVLREQKMKEQREMWGGRGGEVRIIRN
jgi:GLPGLI family protein